MNEYENCCDFVLILITEQLTGLLCFSIGKRLSGRERGSRRALREIPGLTDVV
jgi:hypothetical protein